MWKKFILTGHILRACCCNWPAEEENDDGGGARPSQAAQLEKSTLVSLAYDASVESMVRTLGYSGTGIWEAKLWKDTDLNREPSLVIKVENDNIRFEFNKNNNFSVEGGLYTFTQDGKDDINVEFTVQKGIMTAKVYLLNMNLRLDDESLTKLKDFGDNPIINYVVNTGKLHSKKFIASTALRSLQFDMDDKNFITNKGSLLDELVQISISSRIIGSKVSIFNVTQSGGLLHLTLQK